MKASFTHANPKVGKAVKPPKTGKNATPPVGIKRPKQAKSTPPKPQNLAEFLKKE
ncbi:hypothetical protein [Maritalea sp.]|uniref:hypothetical protein n=1 Tax=Maritalea sp. TaxID=2003361 RepID=UPI003EF72C73